MLLVKTKLNTIKVLISNASTDLNVSQDYFVSVNNTLKEFDDIKQRINNFKVKTLKL